jgi:AbrB family looped-hinge helix DNA binding protein
VTTATLTSKGRITIPLRVRKNLKINEGDRVAFVLIEAGRYELVVENSDVTALKGLFDPASRAVSIQTMNEAIEHRGHRKGKFK